MPRSIAEIRKANGGLANLTDEDILQNTFQAYKSYYPSLDAYAAEVGYGGAGRGLTGSRISAGIDQYQANLLGLGGAIARGVGATDTAAAFDTRREANESAAAYAAQRSRDLGGIEDWRDVTGVGSGLNYIGGLAAQSLPYLGEAVAGGLTGGLALGGTAARMGLTRAAASTAGAVGASYPSAVGDVLSAQRDAGGENLGAAALGGVPYAALNALGIEGQLARGMRPLIQGEGSLARRLAVAVPTTAVAEGLSETGQEIINQYAGRMAVDPNETLFNEAANKRYLDSFVGGATLGGVFGGVGGLRSSRPEEGAIDLTQPDTPTPLGKSITGTDPASLMGNPLAGANLLGGTYPAGLTAFGNPAQPTTASLLSQETDLTAPAGTTPASTAPLGATLTPPVSVASTAPAASKIFSADEQQLLTMGINPSGKTLTLLPKLMEANLTEEQLDSVRTTLAQNKFKQAEKLIKQAAAQNIINAMSAATQGATNVSAPLSTGSGVSGGVGVGGAVVPGTVGTAGSTAPVTTSVGGSTATAGAPLQQAGILPDAGGQPSTTVVTLSPEVQAAQDLLTAIDRGGVPLNPSKINDIARNLGLEVKKSAKPEETIARLREAVSRAVGQPSTTVTTGAPAAPISQPPASGQFKRAPKPMTVLEAAEAAKGSQTGTKKQAVLARGEVTPDVVRNLSDDQLTAELTNINIGDAEYALLQNEQARRESANAVDERQVVLQQIFGERNGDIIFDVIGMGMSEPEAATKYNLSRQAIQKIAGATGQKTWPERISRAKAEKGLTDAQIAEAFNTPTADSLESQVQTDVFGQNQERMDEGEAIEAGLENIVKTAGAGTSEVEGFTKLQNEIDATLEALAAETDEAILKELNEKLAEQLVKVRAVEEKAKAEVRAMAGRKSKKDEADEATAQAETTKPVGETDAVQVTSTALVPVQSETKSGKGVGGQVRRAEKPAGKGQTQGQAKEQINRGKALWESLSAKTPGLVPYEQLNKLEQDYLTDLAVRTNGKPSVAKEMGLQQLLTREPVTIDVESRIIDEQVTQQVAALPAPQIDRLEQHYGNKRDSAEFLAKVQADITKYVTQGAEAVAGAIRSIIKAMAEGVLAMGIVFNPNITKDAFNINVGKTFQQTIEVTQEVPAEAKAQMSPTAQTVYSAMAPVAMKSGKWFMVADKPNGMLHIFKEDGSHALSDPTLYGKDKGDVLDAVSSLEGGPKITPAGTFTMKESPASYAGGTSLILMESKDYTGYIAVHAADTSTPSENRLGRLASATAEDNRISYGCINTKHDTFINQIKPNISKLDGGMMFILPDAQDQAAQMFAAETRTETRTEGGQGAKSVAAASVVGKEENMLFGKSAEAKTPYSATELTNEIKNFIRADILGRKLVIVNKVEDLLNSRLENEKKIGKAIADENAYGVADDGTAYLIANRISKGEGRAKFMHEVGAHLGLENLLPQSLYKNLTSQLAKWAKANDGSLEATIAARAQQRVAAAQTKDRDKPAELLAYFVEEAMLAGIDPTAAGSQSSPLADWFRTLWAAFKIALRKLGFKPESLNTQDVINLAFGAARLEMNGTWHGTASLFRNFSHKFMSTGEGAQAYGWGTYLAQSVGVGRGYWEADVIRKTWSNFAKELENNYMGWTVVDSVLQPENRNEIISAGTKIVSSLPSGPEFRTSITPSMIAKDLQKVDSDIITLTDGKQTFDVYVRDFMPEGSLMRLDTAVSNDELLDWDAPFSDQPQIVRDFIKGETKDIQKLRATPGYSGVQITAGQHIYKYLVAKFFVEGGYNKTGTGYWPGASDTVKMKVIKQASQYLDSKGIKGVRLLDADSRDMSLANTSFVKGDSTVSGRAAVLKAYFTPGAIVQGYGGPDKVIKFDPVSELITVIAVDNLGNPRRGERQRTHFTIPSFNEVAIGMQQRGYDLAESTQTRNLVIFDEKNIFRIGSEIAADRQRMKFGKNAPTQGTIQRNIAKLPKASRSPVRNIVLALGDVAGAGLDYVVFTSDLVKRAVDAGLTSAQTFANALSQRRARVSEFEREIERIADGYADIEPEFKGAGRGSVNDFLFESTRTLKWGYDSGKLKADPAMAIAFNKLGPKAQQFVKNVFTHGDKILSQKKQSVLKSANSEYDAMIQAAQDAVNAAQIAVNTAADAKAKTDAEKQLDQRKQDLAEVKAEKVATLKRFQTLFAIREGKPYAPIKRDGAYVVIGKSAEYKTAETAKDSKRIKQLESDPDHYHVSFVDTKWAARTLSDNLTDQGVFTKPDIVKRATAFEEAFSGEALLPALTKIRAAVDKRDTSDRSKMLNIVNQLYLEALAEGSARKSEMRRRGVAGEVDMLQAFTRQGRADANFLANVEFEPLIQDALQQMRNDRGGNRERKSEIFDELTKRYVDSLETKGNGFITGLTNTASKYFLASSPAYYMQNLTQPFMMSLPALAGRHDYTKAGKALFDAYAELGPLFKNVKLFDQQFDFSKVPADVRAAITKLVNQGQIDIGLATEINEYKVDADSKLGKFAQRLNKSMRLAVQKVEATNRLSTAIAAYRLELARLKKDPNVKNPEELATQYAADILTDTHGDYTAMNAPRIFNSQWGKVALQFRKFQLIQIAFYAKLLRDAFTNPAERAVAMRTLAFSLGHTAVFAGMMGLPGYAAIAAILGAFGDEDEPYDLTADMRQALGPEWADLVMRGAPTLVGVDLSGKIGAGNMLSIMPFSDADLGTTAGRAEAFGTLVGGASLGMVSRVADGMGLILSGDYYKGIERTMPKGVSDALKAGRQAAEGMTRRNGDVVLPADEINAISAILTGLGVPSVKEAVVYERQNRMRDVTENFQDRTTRVKNDYVRAVKDNDAAAKQSAREAWQKLQRTRQENGLKMQPLSDLLKAPQEQAKRERMTVGGVQYTKGTRKLAEEIAGE
jgi:hypothetical protein